MPSPTFQHISCRECSGYRYLTATMPGDRWGERDRLELRKRKLSAAVGKGRPKHMYNATYDRLQDQLIDVEIALDDWMEREFQKELARSDRWLRRQRDKIRR